MNLGSAARLWRTVRHLRLVQLYWRLIFKFGSLRDLSQSLTNVQQNQSGLWTEFARRKQSLYGPMAFRLINENYDLKTAGWEPPHLSALFQYNLHYFDDLNSQNSSDRTKWHHDLIAHWISENPPAKGKGWEPYPTSLRLTNWIKWSLSGHCLSSEAKQSLFIQTRWLARRLEWHLLGNHLFVNAKALVFSGLFFEGPEAQKWLTKGIKVLSKEIPEQILPDGGHFERSPMYHALALEDMLDLVNISQVFDGVLSEEQRVFFSNCRSRIPAMLHWLETFSHPDGGIAFFNDASFSIAPDNKLLFDYAYRLGIKPNQTDTKITRLSNSGYARLELGKAVVLTDIAPIGPDYLPAHAHADTLSFEMSLDKKRVIVNSGTSVYGISEERHRQRGTAAHSTLCIEGENSSEVWGGFRVGRRAYVSNISAKATSKILKLSAQHEGYCHLAGQPKHRRTWYLEDSSLTIHDDIIGSGSPALDIRFHLAPNIYVQDCNHEMEIFSSFDKRKIACVRFTQRDAVNIENSTWHPEFGKEIPNLCISIKFEKNLPYSHSTIFKWE